MGSVLKPGGNIAYRSYMLPASDAGSVVPLEEKLDRNWFREGKALRSRD